MLISKKNKKFLVIIVIAIILSAIFLIPIKIIKADNTMSISVSPNPVKFDHNITLKWSCPSGNCEAKSEPSYNEWSGDITEKSGQKSFKIDKFDKLEVSDKVGVTFTLETKDGGIASTFLEIKKDSIFYLIAIDNNDTTNQSTSALYISEQAAKTKGIELQYSYAPGTWEKISSPSDTRWEGNLQNNSDKMKSGLTNINPLSTSTGFCLGSSSYDLGTCVDVIIVSSPPPPDSSASINARPQIIQANGSTTIIWGSENVDTCSITETPSGQITSEISTKKNGTTTINNISTTTEFKIECKKGTQSISDKVTVTVFSSPKHPTSSIIFWADPASITEGSSTTLYWDLGKNDPQKCSPSSSPDNNQWTSLSLSSSGSTTISNLDETTNFYIICNATSATATVEVTNKQKPSPMELGVNYFTRDIMSTQICGHKNTATYQWGDDKDQEQFCQDYPKYILNNLHTFTAGSTESLKKSSGCYNEKINANNFLDILTGEVLTNLLSWWNNLWGRNSDTRYITNIDYILRKTEVNRCLFDQCCIYSGKAENLNEVVEGTEEPKYPMTLQEIESEGAFLTKREQEDARNLLDFFCCR